MKIVAFGQQKGGVGKSSAAINCACQAVAHQQKAAIIDMDDEQGTTLKWRKRRGKDSPAVMAGNAVNLQTTLERLRREGYHWAFLDLPGRNAPVASAGLIASHLILVPCRPLDVDLEASVETVKAAKGARKRYSYLMNISTPQRQRANHVIEYLTGKGHPVCPAVIVQRIIVPDAIARGQGVGETNPGSESDLEFKALYEWLKAEITL
jgi:chromosome partitioning protein